MPGLLLIFSGRTPLWAILPLKNGELELGRDSLAHLVQDGRISRRHARVFLQDGQFYAADLGSLNGSSVDGKIIAPNAPQLVLRCLRIGDTLLLCVADVRHLTQHGLAVQEGRVMGPRLCRIYLGLARLARSSTTLHITGESGVGKEDAARAFHTASQKHKSPFIAVNCAAIPEGIAERLLFGAKKGAFSGATADVEGYIQGADGGTLFLDEVAELHSSVQAKLLRVLENREVQALGAVRPTPVELRVCSASHTSLRAQVADGKLREDLYYRIGRPEVRIPALRERLEEIPWLVDLELKKIEHAPWVHFSFIEACLLRHWPGNIRELLVEVRAAVQEASAEGSPRLEAKHLPAAAGQAIKTLVQKTAPGEVPTSESSPLVPPQELPPPAAPQTETEDERKRREIEGVLRQTGGNISRAARALGMHRTSLRRLMARLDIDPARISGIILLPRDDAD